MDVDTSDEAFWDYANDQRPEHREKLIDLTMSIAREFPQLERVIAWSIPYFRAGTQLIVGLEIVHDDLKVRLMQLRDLDAFTTRLANYTQQLQVVSFPVYEDLNEVLVHDLVSASLEQTFS